MNVDQVGEFLEHQGFSDNAIDAYFEHHGVKGQKWGVRQAAKRAAKGSDRFGNRNNPRMQRRIDRVKLVASGKASLGDKIRAAAFNIPVRDIVAEGGSLKGASQHAIDRSAKLQRQTVAGKHNVTDIMNRIAGVDIRDLNI